MRLVKKHPTLATAPIVAQVPPRVAKTITAFWEKEGSWSRAQDALRVIRKQGLWIACDCRGEGVSPPIMALRRLQSGAVTLVRLLERTAHASQCPFAQAETPSGSEPDIAARQAIRLAPSFLFKEDELLLQDKSEARTLNKLAHNKILHQRLLWLLAAAREDEFGLGKANLAKSLSHIREAALSVPVSNTHTLGSVLWTREDWLIKGWISGAFRKLEADGWPRNIPLQGYLLLN